MEHVDLEGGRYGLFQDVVLSFVKKDGIHGPKVLTPKNKS
jgi:hypothetical protein